MTRKTFPATVALMLLFLPLAFLPTFSTSGCGQKIIGIIGYPQFCKTGGQP